MIKAEKMIIRFVDKLTTRVYEPFTEWSLYQPKTPQKYVKGSSQTK